MQNFFLFNNATNTVELNTPDLLLIKEFSALVDKDRNKTKEDPKGTSLSRAFREFTYIYLMISWTSPYSDYTEQERHSECLKDANLTEKEWNDPIFRAACRKYREMQNSSRVLKLIKSAQGVIDKITDYFDTLDIQERDAVTGKPIFKTKDVMAELANVSGIVEQLKTLEILYKKEQEQSSSLMGNVDVGFAD
jgi:hypothetical protein